MSTSKTNSLSKYAAWMVLLCTSMPSFMLQMDANIVSVSLPAISRSLGASFADIEWVVTAYMLSFASLVLPAGALADRFGRKKLLIIGLSVFSLASVMCAAASNLTMLVLARSIQGAGAATQLSAALAILSHVFQGAARARAFSFWGAVVGIGMASGPVVGGIITQAFGWEWSFLVNPPIGAVLIVLILKFVDSSSDPLAARLDLPGMTCFSAALFLTTLALIEGNHRSWTDRQVISELAVAIVLFTLFVVVERRQARPMLDLSLFRHPTFLGGNVAQLSFAAVMLVMLIYTPIFLQSGLGYSAATAGVMMLPMVVPLFIVPHIVTRHLAFRLSGRALLTLGLLLISGGLLWLAAVVPGLAYDPMIGGMVIMGIGAGVLNGETTKVGMTAVPRERAGMASGVSGIVRFTGLVVGTAAMGVVLYGRVSMVIDDALRQVDASDRQALVQAITAGHLSAARLPGQDLAKMVALAVTSFASGYQWLYLSGALFMAIAAALTWRLVRSADTPPTSVPRQAVSAAVTNTITVPTVKQEASPLLKSTKPRLEIPERPSV